MKQELGTFTVSTGTVTVTDPCYKPGTWCTAVVKNVVKGPWKAEVNVINAGGWGNRVSSLIVRAVGSNRDTQVVQTARLPNDIGVDAGVCGVFEDKPDYTGDWSNVCDEMRDGYGGIASKHNAFRCEGAWSSSGYGDGGYDAYVGYNKDGEVVQIEIDYHVVNEDEDEDEEEEEDIY